MFFRKIQGFEFKDEREFIAEMLSFKGLKGVLVDQLGKTLPDLLKYTLDIQGTYVQQNFNMMNHGLYEAAGEAGSNVLLSGFGGDELVSARTAFPWNEMILKGQWAAMKDELFSRGITPKTILKPGLIAARFIIFPVQPEQIQFRSVYSRIADKAFAEFAPSTFVFKATQP